MLKGIQSVDDAVMAAESGVSGIILSNHGGRQLDGAPATLDLLPRVVQAVGSDVEVLLDGGVQRGSDVVKAIALGAKAVLIGKSYLYGLAAGGEAGVDRTYSILTDEMTRVMQLLGCKSISELNSGYVRLRK
jgi:isopentenyl diphosphate isomerase/L-lactate dehydrogenase-like FMN-dependent dehydrogenase